MNLQDYQQTFARMYEYREAADSLAYLWSEICRPHYSGERFRGILGEKTVSLVKSVTDDYTLEHYDVDALEVPVEMLFLSPEEQRDELWQHLHRIALAENEQRQRSMERQRAEQIEMLQQQQKAATDKLRELGVE